MNLYSIARFGVTTLWNTVLKNRAISENRVVRLSSPGRVSSVHPAGRADAPATLAVESAGSAGQRMARVYGEPVEVQTREDGHRPARFVWRGRLYTVRSVAEHWVVNRQWWQEADPAPAHPELEFWRVEASTGRGQPAGTYELRRDVAAGTWTLRRVAD